MGTNIDLPTFDEREILLYEKLNAAFAAIGAKFLSGISTADLSWPLTAQGTLDMSIYEITNGRKIWGFVNAAEYDTLADAVSAAGTGGVVIIPPNTTVTTSGDVNFSGVHIIGSGATSVIKFTSGASTHMLYTASSTNKLIANVMLDGNSAGTLIGVDLAAATETVFENVWFKNFTSDALKISSCSNVLLHHCHFSGGSAGHLKSIKAGLLMLSGCTFDTAAGVALLVDVSGVSDTTVLCMNSVAFSNCSSNAVKVMGWNAVGSTSPVEVYATDVVVSDSAGATAAVIIGGATTDSVSVVQWRGGKIENPTAGGMSVNASKGTITGVHVNSPGTFGIDLDTSANISVHDCTLIGDGVTSTVGIDGSGCTGTCLAHHNVTSGFTTAVSANTYLVIDGNIGASTTMLNHTDVASTGVDAVLTSMTIPAGALKDGDRLCIDWVYEVTASDANDTIALRLNGQTLKSDVISATGVFAHRVVVVYTGATTGYQMVDTSGGALTSLAWGSAQLLEVYYDTTPIGAGTVHTKFLAVERVQGVLA